MRKIAEIPNDEAAATPPSGAMNVPTPRMNSTAGSEMISSTSVIHGPNLTRNSRPPSGIWNGAFLTR